MTKVFSSFPGLILLALFGAAFSSVLPPSPLPINRLVDRSNYDDFKVYSVILSDKGQLSLIEQLQAAVPIDIWQAPRPTLDFKLRQGQRSDSGSDSASPLLPLKLEYQTIFMVSPEDNESVEEFLHGHNLQYSIRIPNVGHIVEEQRMEMLQAQKLRSQAKAAGAKAEMNWDNYFRSDEIYEWLDELVGNNSDIAQLSIIGKSTEGRDLKLVKISKPGSAANKTAVLIDGGFHAREWISPAIVTYILDQLLNNRADNSQVLDEVDVYIIPIVNIDGVEYSHESSRMWRKTRSNNGGSCRGVDPNRNFDFHFGGSGTSGDTCSEIYRGPAPFSEPEARAVRDVAMNSSINWRSYLTIHSFGQWWLTPWSWTDDLPEDYKELMRFGNIAADALTKVHNTPYVVGATTEILGATAGCSDDWAKAVAGIKYANTIEVRDTGDYGFLLPPSQIHDTAEETWAGIRQVLLYINRLA